MKHLLLVIAVMGFSACCSSPTAPAPATTPPPPVRTEAVPIGGACGGIAPRACVDGAFCDVPGHCGAADQSGTCAEKTQMCTRDFRPVCGCDGKTYGNTCTAHAAGVSVQADGRCPGDPE